MFDTLTPGSTTGEFQTMPSARPDPGGFLTILTSYGRFWVTTDQAAALWLISIISMPSRNLTPSMSLGN